MKKNNSKPGHYFIFPLVPKNCAICGGSNPPCAKYCGDCGSSFIITRIRQSDDVTRKGDRTVIRKIFK